MTTAPIKFDALDGLYSGGALTPETDVDRALLSSFLNTQLPSAKIKHAATQEGAGDVFFVLNGWSGDTANITCHVELSEGNELTDAPSGIDVLDGPWLQNSYRFTARICWHEDRLTIDFGKLQTHSRLALDPNARIYYFRQTA